MVAIVATLFLAVARASGAPKPAVTTSQGRIIGTTAAVNVERFAGIPFAEPPTGRLRFARAVQSTKSFPKGVLDASLPGAPCIQNPLGDPRPPDDLEAPPPSEDCLTLNIWRPSPTVDGVVASRNVPAAGLPVMVYVFGGGLCGGFAGNRYFNGSELAIHHNVIVVTVSYRLGALGFLPLGDDWDGAQKGGGGMNGFHDVIVALQWLRDNVGAFGGSPDEVTLFGQSSGGYTICNLCVSPAAAGLFNKAVLMSGPCIQGPPGKGWGAGQAQLGAKIKKEVMAAVNATSLAQLRAVVDPARIQWPAAYMDDLDKAPYFSGYFPDSAILPGDGDDAAEALWRKGAINPSALIIGHVSKDGTSAFYGTAPTLGLVEPDKKQTSPADYHTALKAAWGPSLAQQVLDQYPLASYGGSPQSAFIQGDADVFVICPSMSVARYAGIAGRKVWNYEFAHFQPSYVHPEGYGCDNGVELDVTPGSPAAETVRWATHGSEFHYIFGTTVGPDGVGPPNNLTHCPFKPKEQHLSSQMMAYWAAFAQSGNPNDGCVNSDGATACPEWPEFIEKNSTTIQTMLFVDGDLDKTDLGPVVGLHGADCAFWSTIYPPRGDGET